MDFFDFGKSIISWIKTFNNNVKLSVNQCGNLSSFFGIGRGCRQGDPVSTYLFILCAEILGIMIRNNMNITAFKLLGINFHIELKQMQQINFKEKNQKIRSLIKLWNKRYLTPLGKITVI